MHDPMDREIDYFRGSTSAPTQAAVDRSAFSKTFPSIGSAEMPYYHGSDAKYQDFSSPWSSAFMGESEDFMVWPAGLLDCETTDQASEDLDSGCQIVSSSSDEDSDRQVSFVDNRVVDNRAVEQPSFSRREPLPEEGFVDIDPEEGRRRGDELFAMLTTQEAPDTQSESDAASQTTLSANAPMFTPPTLSTLPQQPSSVHSQHRQQRQPQSQRQWAATWEGCGTGGWSSDSSEPTPPNSRHAAAIHQASHAAFGSMMKEVVVANNGCLVLLHESMRQYEQVPVLDILSRALWPLLGKEVVALDHCVAPAGQPRLAMRMHGTRGSQCCWEFATTGACPRGYKCRWEHEAPSASVTYIDIVF